MTFIQTDLETILNYLNALSPDSQARWGTMSAQRMVEHLTDSLRIATGKNPQTLLVPEEKLDKMLAFLESDKPMAKDVQVPFARPEMELRHEEIELAVDEFVEEWLEFEELYESNPEHREIHPYYGPLNKVQWERLNAKHLTHHFEQFGLIA
jgi:hypothetical protein